MQSGYKRNLIPSVDRKIDDIHYCFANIQLMTWEENSIKAHNDMILGIMQNSRTPHRAVSQFDKQTKEKLATYISLSEAKRQTGISAGSIHQVCNLIRKSAGGFIWRYEDGK